MNAAIRRLLHNFWVSLYFTVTKEQRTPTKKPFGLVDPKGFVCDHDWSRTSTPVRALPPQSSASTNSATWPSDSTFKKRTQIYSRFAKINDFLQNYFKKKTNSI
jgi:hypothetical protein